MEKNNVVDIERIMDEIRAEIIEKGLTDDLLSFEDSIVSVEFSSMQNSFKRGSVDSDYASLNSGIWNLNYYMPLSGNKISVFFKRAMRKLVKFLIYPLSIQQSTTNASIVRILNSINYFIDEYEFKESKTDEVIALLNMNNEKKFTSLINKNNTLTETNKKLTAELERYMIESMELRKDFDEMKRRLTLIELDNKILQKKPEKEQ